MDRVRERIGDPRVLTLVKAFLKAGIMTEHARLAETPTGTPQGGILSPLLANIALSALDEHFACEWQATGATGYRRRQRRQHGLPNYRLVRYADDFVVCLAGDRRHATALIEQIKRVISPLGLVLSMQKTRVAHIDEGFEFLGFATKRCPGRDGRRYVYTYPSKPSLAAVKAKVRAITRTGHNQTLDQLLHRLTPVLRGWCAYFRHGVSKQTFNYLRAFTWRRVVQWLRRKHPKANWRWLRARYLPGWWPAFNGVVLYNPAAMAVTRYRYRGAKIATPWPTTASA